MEKAQLVREVQQDGSDRHVRVGGDRPHVRFGEAVALELSPGDLEYASTGGLFLGLAALRTFHSRTIIPIAEPARASRERSPTGRQPGRANGRNTSPRESARRRACANRRRRQDKRAPEFP